jgi:serine/threonine-protein kinase HipA
VSNLLQVMLGGTPIGTLSFIPNGSSFFAFDEAYINNPNRPTLSQSFFTSSGALITKTKPVFGKLPNFFSNLLPEGRMRDYLA